MIVLDTDVVSEPLKPNPDPAVLIWLDNQEPQTLYLTAIHLAELFAGVEALLAGRKKTQLHQAIKQQLLPLFAGRFLSFDQQATETFARINAKAQAEGAPIGFADCANAAIASAHGFLLATRNVRDFQHAGIALLNPWAERV